MDFDSTAPLPTGTVLNSRYEVESVLGRGGFSTVYLAKDKERGDRVAVKELVPDGARRLASGILVLNPSNETAHRLKERFIKEAQILGKLRLKGVQELRSAWHENGTAYLCTTYFEGSQTLEAIIQNEGRLSQEDGLEMADQLLDILDRLHKRGFLHRDLKPSNVLVQPDGSLELIDFGAARQWEADRTDRHTILFTPGYAPIEQLSEHAKRSPATDLYGLSATLYTCFTGKIPLNAPDRLNGIELPSLGQLRPDLSVNLVQAIEAGLALYPHHRPQNVAEFRKILKSGSRGPVAAVDSLASWDEVAVRLQKIRPTRRGCPVCEGIMEEPVPIKPGRCLVCRTGRLVARDIDLFNCPFCSDGRLVKRSNVPLSLCPRCQVGVLESKRLGLIGRKKSMFCPECGFKGVLDQDEVLVEGTEEPVSIDQLRAETGRADSFMLCDSCHAQLDFQPDGRLKVWLPKSEQRRVPLYPEEWARVAVGLDPGAGNVTCEACQADYYQEGKDLTLLSAESDPFDFADAYLGRLLRSDSAHWLAVGKSSGKKGLVCPDCHLELDEEEADPRDFRQSSWQIVQADTSELRSHLGETHTWQNLHRLAVGAPQLENQGSFESRLPALLIEAYESAQVSLTQDPKVLWRGDADEDGKGLRLTVDDGGITLSRGLKKRTWMWRDVAEVRSNDLVFEWEDRKGEVESLELVPQVLRVDLRSGKYETELNADNLARRIRRMGLG